MSTIAHLAPYGDKLCLAIFNISLFGTKFPSPRGDKLCPGNLVAIPTYFEFPSPRGDKLCLMIVGNNTAGLTVSVPSRG